MSSVNPELQSLIARHMPGYLSQRLSLTRLNGLTGTSWRIDDDHQPCWLAKALLPSQHILGINRRQEYRTLRRISSSGLSPVPVLLTDQWLITSWVDGAVIGEGFSRHPDLAGSLVRLHQRPLIGFPLDLTARFIRYMQGIDRKRLSPRWLSLHQSFLRAGLPRALKLAPAHLDLHGDNAIQTPGGLKFIDWEYAADTDIAFELAALFYSNGCGNGWNKALESDLIQRYINAGGYHNAQKLTRQVDRWKPYVDYLMLMWFETRWQQTKNPQYIIDSQPIRVRYGI
ncbi:phosphotransferase [Budvicia diplopodorum]|uniref:phosphotransferase n=1 Tax=Budvicia diplopodorum TaxID=1119056 RepID=UPI001357BB03|nr:phosphotransferase [Budvicia diplopodorum]